jgi:hypothetical protein
MERELDAAERDECESHLRECEACRGAASWLELASELARDAPPPGELSAARMERVVEAVMARIDTEPASAKRPRRRVWAYAPALASLAALSVLAFVLVRAPMVDQLLPSTVPSLSRNEEQELPEESAFRAREQSSADRLDSGEARELGPPESARDADTADEAAGRLEPSPEEPKAEALADRPTALRQSEAELRAGERAQKSVGSARIAAPLAKDATDPWSAIGEREPENAAQADSLRGRLEERLRDEADTELQEALRRALEELDRRWPQDPEAN